MSGKTSQMNPERWIVLGSANGSTNLGDESMWLSAVRELRNIRGPVRVMTDGAQGWDPGVSNVEVIPSFQQTFRRGYRIPIASLRKLIGYPGQRARALRLASPSGSKHRGGVLGRRWRAAIAGCDGVIFSGAGAITDDFAVHGVASWSVLTEWASLMGKPIFFLGQGVGPLENTRARSLVAKMLSSASVVSVRDSRSADVVKGLNSAIRVHVTPDWAILNSPTAADRQQAEELKSRLVGASSFQVLSLHRRHSTSKLQIEELSRWARRTVEANVARNVQTLFVPNMSAGRFSDDRNTADLLTSMWPSHLRDDLVVLRDVYASGVVRALLGLSQGVIATRYHPVVFALAEGVNAYGISYDEYYDQKLEGALENFGMNKNVSRLGSPDSDPATVLNALQHQPAAIDMKDIRQRTLEPVVGALKALAP